MYKSRSVFRVCLIAPALLVLFTAGGELEADSPTEEVRQVVAANDKTLASLDDELNVARARLDRLKQLQARGRATWRETAEQEIVVEFLQAKRRSTVEFAAFLKALSQRAECLGTALPERTNVVSDTSSELRLAALRVAAAEAGADGELQIAKVELRRQQARLEKWKILTAAQHASRGELRTAQLGVQDALALVAELEARHKRLTQAYQTLLEAYALQAPDLRLDESDELQMESLPPELFANGDHLRHLIDLRREEGAAAVGSNAAAAQLKMNEELAKRLVAAGRQSTLELDAVRFEIERLDAQVQFFQQRRHVLQLEERRFVLQVRQPSYAESPAVFDSLAKSEYVPRGIESTATSRYCFRPASEARRPISSSLAADPPFRNFALNTPRRLADLPLYGSRFNEPEYHDYYEFGIRRTDLPPRERERFMFGLPWYLPGSPTNFR